MDRLLDYKLVGQISKKQNTEIYRALDKEQKNVVIKLLREEFIDSEKLGRFRKEYEITLKLSSEWVITPLDYRKYNDTYFIVLEDFGGTSLNQFISKNSPCTHIDQLISMLEIAILIIKAINDIHNHNIIHKDINPSNIVYSKDKGLLKIIDFELATKLNDVQVESSDDLKFEGTFPYISPEQTGRFNRTIDYRTDFYSYGITLYELFSGALPFNAESTREWIHCHIAKKPINLNILNPNIPKEVSDIVMKLLNKTVEHRYQSGYGIIRDLEKCLNDLTSFGKITGFKPGKFDVPQRFQIPQKLYGRNKEINKLLSFYNGLKNNECAMIMFNGYAGVGKTSVIQEIQRPIIESRGFFTIGKYDQLKKNIPYSAFLQALSKLLKSILSDSKEEIKIWKQKLLNNLNGNGQLIVNLIPELKHIIGEQPKLPDLPPSESQNRFISTFKNFINSFTTEENPLVLFLDDLHWADTASLDMIENLMLTHHKGSLLLIGAYRNNEVNSDNPLTKTLNKIKKAHVKFQDIHIEPLSENAVEELFIDNFSFSPDIANSLAQLSIAKTNGNPFFLIEFLKSLYLKKLLYYNAEVGKWNLEHEEVEKYNVSENVAEFISNSFKVLPDEVKQILKTAACIGSKFDAGLLYKISHKPWGEIISLLNKSCEQSFIFPLTGQYRYAEFNPDVNVEYKFVHDRVQQEVYSMIDNDERKEIHLSVGRYLLKDLSELEKDELLYTVLEHLNKGIDYLNSEEIIHLANMNLKACDRSKKAGAFDHSLFFTLFCLHIIDDSIWQSNYWLAFQIHKEHAEALALVGNYTEMENTINKALAHVKDIVEKTQLLEIKVQSYISQHRQPEAVNEALKALKLLHIRFPNKPGPFHIVYNLLKTSLKLKKIKSANDIKIQKMTEPEVLAAMNLMAKILSASYYVNPNLFPLIVFKLIQKTLSNGIAPKSPVAFITLGLIDYTINKMEQGHLHSQIGLKMFEKVGAKEHWAQASCIFYSSAVWNEPLKNSIKGLFTAYKSGIDTGDNEFAVASVAAGLSYKFFSGVDIRDLFNETKMYEDRLAYLNQNVPFNQIKVLLQTIQHFIDSPKNPEILVGDYYDENEMLPRFIELKDNASALDLYLKKMILAYHFKRIDIALEIVDLAREIVKDVSGLLLYGIFHFYESLILLNQQSLKGKNSNRTIAKRIRDNQKRFKKWSKTCPANFENKFCLLQAEIEKNKGNFIQAAEQYDKAIKLSQQEGNLTEQALCNELAGEFWLSRNNKEIAQLYLNKAYRTYKIWGANAKASEIRDKFNDLIVTSENKGFGIVNQSFLQSKSGSSLIGQHIDLETILEAAKAISSEIIFNNLIKKTLTIILEHAGAQKGMLLIKDEQGDITIEATGYVEDNKIKVELGPKLLSNYFLPISIIRYLERTNETIILHNAENSDFSQDDYIKLNHVKSVISIPILHQSKFSGILYLENNLSTNVFDQERVDILTILCTQAAISIENAILYDSLEKKVLERTKEISEKNFLLQNQKEKIEQARNELAELNATKDKFFSIIAHDLRGPIGTISQSFDLLANEDIHDFKNYEEFIESFKRVSKNTYDLLNNLLAWAKSQKNELVFNPELTSLNRRVETNISLIKHKAQRKGVFLISKLAKETIAYFDINLIDTVIRNLLNNALKYTSRGDSITISIESKDKFAIVSIRDTGIGMNITLKNSLFSLENKVGSRKGTDGEIGTGLGLILCKEFVEKNRGSIWVESKEFEGSTFHFSVPLRKI